MTNHEMLQKIMDVSTDIEYAAESLGMSDYCPTHDDCSGDCIACWKSWLEKEVKRR